MTTIKATKSGSTHRSRPPKKARKALRNKKAAAAAAAAAASPDVAHSANTHPANAPANAPNKAGNQPSNVVTENLTTITAAKLNALRVIEEYNALGASFETRHAQRMADIEKKVREYHESGYSFGQICIAVILFLLVCVTGSLHNEAEERRRTKWW
jgi:hypothetical protein